jgi:hypothetical protein
MEKQQLEKLFEMGGGYVLDFSNRTFQEFIQDAVGIDIYAGKYDGRGGSKANHLRCFWEKEVDATVGRLLKALVEYALVSAEAQGTEAEIKKGSTYKRSSQAMHRLLGEVPASGQDEVTEEDFLKQAFKAISFDQLPIEGSVIPILSERFQETERCYKAGANLAAVIMSGSILEAVLLGLCQANPQKFNTANSTPKTKEKKAKPFNDWKLAEYIAVAHEVGALKQDVRKFSDNLRDFRNYIHPYAQMESRFSPDRHTAQICLTVLKAAISQVNEWGRRSS